MANKYQDAKEPYETPVVLDIAPVTANVVVGVDSIDEPDVIVN